MNLSTKMQLGNLLRRRRAVRTLRDYCACWLEEIRSTLKDSSYTKYRSQIEKHIIPVLGDYTAEDFSCWRPEDFQEDLLRHDRLSPKTVKDILVLLHTLLLFAGKTESGYLAPSITYPKVPKQEMRVLSRAEQRVLTAYLLEDMDCCKLGVLLALLTGMRIGELCALRWSEISLQEGKLRICATMQRICCSGAEAAEKTRITVTSPKSASSVRVIPLSPMAVSLCRELYCRDPGAYLLTGTGQYMEPRTLQYRLKKYTDACRLQGVHFHTLRHTYATRCMEVGIETKILSEMLGHASTAITLDRYVHASFDMKKESVDKLSAVGM